MSKSSQTLSVSASALSKSARSEASKFLYTSSSLILFAVVFHSTDGQSLVHFRSSH